MSHTRCQAHRLPLLRLERRVDEVAGVKEQLGSIEPTIASLSVGFHVGIHDSVSRLALTPNQPIAAALLHSIF